jgi:leucyl aminopeptidase
MFRKGQKSVLFTGMTLLAGAVIAQPHQKLMVPSCLLPKVTSQYQELAKNKQFSIIDIKSDEVETLAKLPHSKECGRFVDVTRHFEAKSLTPNQAEQVLAKYSSTPLMFKTAAYEIKNQAAVNAAIDKVNSDNIWATLTHLTSYRNRSATEDTGVETAKWLKSQFDKMAKDAGRTDVDSYFVETGWYYKQPSVVTVIGKDIKADAVVVGAHMDTLSGNMPGAGDDGSGSSSVMEVARVLLSEKKLNHPVYIIWYSAEERGLVGSGYVVQDFLDKKIPVKSVVQFDMTGFRNDQDDPTIYVFKDFVDASLSNFVSDLIKEYIKVPVDYSRCGYGCSDHASWMQEGIPAAFPCETDFPHHNPRIHTSGDRMEYLNLEHMTNFAKLGLAFAIELAS